MKPVKQEGQHIRHRRFDPNSTPFIAAAGAGALVLLLGLSILLSSGGLHGRDTGIVLPGSDGDTPGMSTGSTLFTAQRVADVDITTENAQTVISSLQRPISYSSRVENTLYYDGGQAAMICWRYARNGVVRTDTLDRNGTVQSTLLRTGTTVYAWNTGDSSAYKGAAGDFSDDSAAMLPTYEDVLADGIVLTAAGKQNLGYEPCIAVTFEQGGYLCVYAVSTVSGLLKQASFYKGDTLTRQVTVSEVEMTPPDSSLFVLPDGTAIV